MFKSLSRLFKMSKVPASTRPIAHRLRPGLQMLEDRTTPAVSASFSAVTETLTINLSEAGDSGELKYVGATGSSAAKYVVEDDWFGKFRFSVAWKQGHRARMHCFCCRVV